MVNLLTSCFVHNSMLLGRIIVLCAMFLHPFFIKGCQCLFIFYWAFFNGLIMCCFQILLCFYLEHAFFILNQRLSLFVLKEKFKEEDFLKGFWSTGEGGGVVCGLFQVIFIVLYIHMLFKRCYLLRKVGGGDGQLIQFHWLSSSIRQLNFESLCILLAAYTR